MQVLAGIEAEGRASGLAPTGGVGEGLLPALVRKLRELRLDLVVARRDLLLVGDVERLSACEMPVDSTEQRQPQQPHGSYP